MSLTNNRRVPGSSMRSIMRAATPSLSGIEANSATLTVIADLTESIGGSGVVVRCPSSGDTVNAIAAMARNGPAIMRVLRGGLGVREGWGQSRIGTIQRTSQRSYADV